MHDWPVVAATGHRHLNTAHAVWVRGKLDAAAMWLRDQCGTQVAITGMALGVDQWWGLSALAAGLALHCYIPFPQQPDMWRPDQRDTYADLIDRATQVRICDDLNNYPDTDRRAAAVRLLHARNDTMLDAASAVVAVLCSSTTKGGTWSAVQKARRRGLPIVHIDPDRRAVTVRQPAQQGALPL